MREIPLPKTRNRDAASAARGFWKMKQDEAAREARLVQDEKGDWHVR